MQSGCWKKQGLVYDLDNSLPWAASHVQMPTVDVTNSDELDIFFASRNEQNQSLIGRLSVCARNPSRINSIHPHPVLLLGDLGTFDDSGVMPSSIVSIGETKYLYYLGWNVRNTIPYHNSVGLAVSCDGGKTYERMFDGPVMERTAEEPYFCGTTCVRLENGIWRNWYLSCTSWDYIGGKPEPRYHLKYAESKNGVDWKREGRVAIDFKSDAEGGIARASVLRDGSVYKMWYCYRGRSKYRENHAESYRIGYAESADGVDWLRIDDGRALTCSESGWDSEMVAYPEVVEVNGNLYLFYNGNGFGRSGVGYAYWE